MRPFNPEAESNSSLPRSECASGEHSPCEYSTEARWLVFLSAFVPQLFAPLVFAIAFFYGWHLLHGVDDVWAHAAVGRWIWSNGQVPHHSLFLWSVEPPYPWVAHSWLSQFFYFGLLEIGPGAVVAFTIVSTLTVFALLWKLWQRRAPGHLLAPLFFSLAIYAGSLRFRPRPELFTALFFVVLLVALMQFHEARKSKQPTPRFCWLLVPMFAIWANFHGAVLMGVLALCLALLGDALQFRGDARWRQLALLTVLCLGATLLNPFGLDYWRDVVSSSASQMFTNINEWKPPLESRDIWPYAVAEAILVLFAFASWLRNPQRRWSELLWLLVMSALFLRQRRHLWLLAIVALAVAGNNAQNFTAQNLWDFWRKRRPQAENFPPATLRLMARLGVLVWLWVALAQAIPRNFRVRVTSKNLPFAAADYIEKNNVQGRIFNDYENSSYFQWRLNGTAPNGEVPAKGQKPLYIDLLNAYSGSLLDEYLKIWAWNKKGRATFDRHRFQVVILGSDKRNSKIAKALDKNPQWQNKVRGENGLLWIRRSAPSATTRNN